MGIDDDVKNIISGQINSKNGIHVSVSIDIRTVENFFKKLFGKNKTEEDDDGGHKTDS